MFRHGPISRTFGLVGLVGLVIAFPACTDPELGRPLEPRLASIQTHIFDQHCALPACHAGPNVESHMDLSRGKSYRNLVGVASLAMPQRNRVVPGAPDSSYLMNKVTGVRIVGERMPMGKPPLPDTVVSVLREWIRIGAVPE